MNEIWKDIKGYENKYQVSNLGRVKSLPRTRKCNTKDGLITMSVPERIMKQWKRSSYFLVDFWEDGKRDIRSVHILVYETFVGPIQDGNFIHHKDENKENNCVENLLQLSCLEHNRIHCCGRTPWNKGLPLSKESIEKRTKTRRMKNGNDVRDKNVLLDKLNGLSNKELSIKYNVCIRQILTIIKNEKQRQSECC